MANLVIQKKPVYARNEKPSRLYGMFTLSELFTLIAVFFIATFTLHHFLLSIGIDALVYLYFRKVKAWLPERYIKSMIKFKLRPYNVNLLWFHMPATGYSYRSGGRDSSWRSPIIPD